MTENIKREKRLRLDPKPVPYPCPYCDGEMVQGSKSFIFKCAGNCKRTVTFAHLNELQKKGEYDIERVE